MSTVTETRTRHEELTLQALARLELRGDRDTRLGAIYREAQGISPDPVFKHDIELALQRLLRRGEAYYRCDFRRYELTIQQRRRCGLPDDPQRLAAQRRSRSEASDQWWWAKSRQSQLTGWLLQALMEIDQRSGREEIQLAWLQLPVQDAAGAPQVPGLNHINRALRELARDGLVEVLTLAEGETVCRITDHFRRLFLNSPEG